VAVAGCGQWAGAEPVCFEYHVYGVEDYANRGGVVDDIAVDSVHMDFSAAAESADQYMQCTPYDLGYNDTILPPDVASSGTPPFNWADFAVLAVHGPELDWRPNVDTSWYSAGLAPFCLGMDEEYTVGLDTVHFGGDGYSTGYLRWLWAASCDWFTVGWPFGGARTIGTSAPLVCSFGTANLLDTMWTARHWDRTDLDGYLADGVSVGASTLSNCSTGDRYKRNHWFSTGSPVPLNYTFFDSCNVVVVKASAPGGAQQHRGNITVCTGVYPRTTNDAFDPDSSDPIAVVRVFGSGGEVTEYGGQIKRNGTPAYLGSFQTNSLDMYLLFDSCTGNLTVHDVWFYNNPVLDETVCNRMDTLVDTYGPVFDGVHAIMGWSAPSSAQFNRDCFEPFLTSWTMDTTYYTSAAFLSLGTTLKVIGALTGNSAPAIAVAIGPSGDRYRYLFEKWYRANIDEAAGDSCMIAWCVPWFDDPDDGAYWVEE
jgi:hypothetical protein